MKTPAIRSLFSVIMILLLPVPPAGAEVINPGSNSGLSIQPASNGKVLVQWNAAAGTTQLYWAPSLSNPGTWQRLNGAVPLSGNTWQAEIPVTLPRAFFRVQPATTPVPPPNVRLTLVGDHFRLEWDSTSDAAGYAAYVGTAPGTGPGNFLQRLVLPLANVLEINGLTAGQKYYIVIAATNLAGEGMPAVAVSGVYGPKVDFTGRAVQSFLLPSGTNFEVLAEGTMLQLAPVGGGDGIGYQVTVDAQGDFNLRDLPAGSYLISYFLNGQWMLLPAPARLWNGLPLTGPLVLPSGPSPPPPGTTLLGYLRLSSGQPARLSLPAFNIETRGQFTVTFADGSSRIVVPDSLGAWAVPQITGGFPVTITGSYQGLTTTTTIAAPPVTLAPSVVKFPQKLPELQRMTIQQNGQEVFHITPGVPVTFGPEVSNPDNLPATFYWTAEYNGLKLNNTGPTFSYTFDTPASIASGTVQLNFSPGTYQYQWSAGLDFAIVPVTNSGQNCWSGITGIWNPATPNDILPAPSAIVTIKHGAAGSPVVVFPNPNQNGVTWFDAAVNSDSARPYVVRVDVQDYMRFLWPFEWVLPKEATFCAVAVTKSTHAQSIGNTLNITHPSGAAVQIPYGSLRTVAPAAADVPDLPYVGNVIVELAAWDPAIRSPLPPNVESRGPGYRRGLEPFACTWCNLTTTTGAPLSSFGATLTIPAPLAYVASAQPVHHQDETTGYFKRWGDASGHAVLVAPGRYITRLDESGLFVLAAEEDLMEPVFVPDRSINYPFQMLVNRSIFPVTVTGPGKTSFEHLYLPQILGADVEVLDLLQAPGLHYTDPANAPSGRPVEPMKKRVIARAFNVLAGPVAALPAITAVQVPLTLATSEPALKSYINDTTIVAINAKDKFLARTKSTADDAAAYYDHIHAPPTLTKWRERSGLPDVFGAPLPGGGGLATYASCYYYNLGDLGFARAQTMRVLTSPRDNKPNVAFAVSNFHTLEDARCQRAPIATVCMDYSGFSDGNQNEIRRYTRFYVYGGDGKLLDRADLDNATDLKFVPNLCVTCHGGIKYTKGETTDLGSRFLPFDLASYAFHPKFGVQKQEIGAMNSAVLKTLPANLPADTPRHAISDLIKGWYGIPDPITDFNALNTFHLDYVPSAAGFTWKTTAASEALYTNCFKHSCRVCHISRDLGKRQFDSFATFAAESRNYGSTCTGLGMPHSQRTWGIFWGSRASKKLNVSGALDMPSVFRDFAGTEPCPNVPDE